MTIQEHKDKILRLEKEFNKNIVKPLLKNTLERIKFLESIYIIGGTNYGFSENFGDQACAERDELCRQSSACYTILNDRKEEIKK